MRVVLRFKGKSPRHADITIKSEDCGTIPLTHLRELWTAETVINALPGIRLHLEVTE